MRLTYPGGGEISHGDKRNSGSPWILRDAGDESGKPGASGAEGPFSLGAGSSRLKAWACDLEDVMNRGGWGGMGRVRTEGEAVATSYIEKA